MHQSALLSVTRLIHLNIYLSVYYSNSLTSYLSINLSATLSLYVSIYLSIYLSTYLPIWLSIYLSIHLSSVHPSITLSIPHSVCPSICLSIFLPFHSISQSAFPFNNLFTLTLAFHSGPMYHSVQPYALYRSIKQTVFAIFCPSFSPSICLYLKLHNMLPLQMSLYLTISRYLRSRIYNYFQ